jgi:hypothetical protein
MKKNTITTIKSPAPAKKSAKPLATKKVAPAPVAPAAPAPVAVKAAPVVGAPAPVATKPAVTTITAEIDVGFGNALYLRGSGAGLSWDRGLLMESSASDQWRAVLGESDQPIVFKFLVNDQTWCIGEDYTAAAGTSITIAPAF